MNFLLPLLFLWGTAPSQSPLSGPAAEEISFTLERAAPAPTQFAIELNTATGKGFYRQTASAPAAGHSSADAAALPVDAPIAVDPALLKKLLATTPAITRHRCESHNTNIAQTGKKTLRLSEGGNAAECTFNYSDDDRVNTATSLFEAIGETVQYGQRLAAELRYDRLGLDAEINHLDEAVKDGRAIALINIAPVLQRLATDDRVLERVRRQAEGLLTAAGVTPLQPLPATTSSDE